MRPSTFLCIPAALGSAFLCALSFAQTTTAPKRPVYILLSQSVTDHVNWRMSDERLRRTLPVLEKYRKQNPSLSATAYFSGAMSDALDRHNPDDHLLDYVKGFIDRGVIAPGYDGLDEPTYTNRPLVTFGDAKTSAERWRVRMASAKELVTGARDPLTGKPMPGKSGGLKRMQEVFGPASIIRGIVLQMPNLWGTVDEVGDDGEIVNTLREYNKSAVMVGLYESDLGHASGSMFRPWADSFSKVMSPEPAAPPELYWQEDVLRVSETSMKDWRTFRAEDGVDAFKKAVDGLDRSRIRILHIEVGGQRIYATPPKPPNLRPVLPLTWAYRHPDNPLFPANLAFSAQEVEDHYRRQDELLAYLVSGFIPANPGSRFVSPADLKSMVKPAYGYDLPFEKLRASVTRMLAAWGDKPTPPTYLKIEDRYLSLADLFSVLAESLAARNQTGKFPATVHLGRVFAPVSTEDPAPPASTNVTVKSVLDACSRMVPALRDDSTREIPPNSIPSPVEIGTARVNPAQFLRLMSEALVAPDPAATLKIEPTEMFAGRVMTFYTRRLFSDFGAPWTYKPAPVQ